MTDQVVRFGVSLDPKLLDQFDTMIQEEGYTNRSEAIRDLIRERLIKQEWAAEETLVAGTVSLVYDHHELELPRRLTEVQHDHHDLVISTVHVHLDHHNCLEVLVLKGEAGRVRKLGEKLVSTRGIKHGKMTFTTTGAGLA
ncbi:MAG: nickel-responsive transcriptional regulator NikR [Deltaproteobacteria bacterium]|nr:nickel-responsive transcriptional regulator NikR [Deltaproteobacteria bacterium]